MGLQKPYSFPSHAPPPAAVRSRRSPPDSTGIRRDTAGAMSAAAELLTLPGAATTTTTTAASLPVVFFDGDRETNIGTVAVDGGLRFRKFQSTISQRIGISPHQISLSLVRRSRKGGKASSDPRRKTPIDEGSDFAAISKERDCFVLAVLKRSRRGRLRRGHVVDARSVVDEPLLCKDNAIHLPEKTILRRPSSIPAAGEDNRGRNTLYGLGLGPWDQDAMRSLQMQREKYMMSVAAASYYPYVDRAFDFYSGEAEAVLGSYPGGDAGKPLVCKVCSAHSEEMGPPPFHWCVYDAVTVGFRSRAGPIERPSPKWAQVDDEVDY